MNKRQFMKNLAGFMVIPFFAASKPSTLLQQIKQNYNVISSTKIYKSTICKDIRHVVVELQNKKTKMIRARGVAETFDCALGIACGIERYQAHVS